MTFLVPNVRRLRFGVLAGWQLYEGITAKRYLHTLLRGIHAAAAEHGFHLLLGCGVGRAAGPGLRTPAWPVPLPYSDFVPVGPWNCDGIVVIPPLIDEERASYIRHLRANGYPIVFAGAGEAGPTVAIDNRGGVAQAVRHVYAHGHRQIAYVAGFAHGADDSYERRSAYIETLQALGLPFDPRLMVYGDHTTEGGERATRTLLDNGAHFTALVASNDDSAFGAMRALHAAGLLIPDDVAVIGFDDVIDARVQAPPLTTVHHTPFEVGRRALLALHDLVHGMWDGVAPIQVPARLVVRRSCGCAPGQTIGAHAALVTENEHATLVQHMAEAALTEMARGQFEIIRPLCAQLAGAFAQALDEHSATPFQRALLAVMRTTEALGEDPTIWQNAMTVLRDHAINNSPRLANDMIDQARLVVGERVRRHATRALIQHMDVADRVGVMTAQLLAVFEEAHLAATMAAHLDNLGIRHLLVARYQPDEDDPVAWAEIVLRCGMPETAPRDRFRTRSFPPPGLYPEGEALRLAVLPLVDEEQVIGFAAFDAANLEPCAAIMRNLASALRTSRLYQEARDGRRLAEEAFRLKSRFLSMVSHELRTPLNLIAGLSDMLLREEQVRPALPGELREDLERMSSSAQHLGRLIGDVLDLASSDAGQLRLAREPLDVRETLHMVAATGERLAREKHLEWRASLPPLGLRVFADRTRLRQVVLNLVSNAVKFTEHGYVALDVWHDEGQVQIRVSDSGLGIPPEEHGRIFEEFQRSEQSVARGYRGLGLGLTISKQLVELHGGCLMVESSGQHGDGSRFYVKLPLLDLPADAAAAPVRATNMQHAASDEPKTVLIVDDMAEMRELHARMLRSHNAALHIRYAEHGRQALHAMRQQPPDLLLLDLFMPELDGFGVLDAMRADPLLREIPVIVLSAQELGEDELARLSRGVSVTLAKGVFSAEETLAHVEAALERRRKLGDVTQRLVYKAIGFIHAHYAEPLSREQIARHVGVNENYLTDCFHREMGITPIAYLARYRVRQARYLLEHSNDSVTDIALAVGFSDSAYFSRVFQRETGMSPSAYRRREPGSSA